MKAILLLGTAALFAAPAAVHAQPRCLAWTWHPPRRRRNRLRSPLQWTIMPLIPRRLSPHRTKPIRTRGMIRQPSRKVPLT